MTAATKEPRPPRHGFLPIHTNGFDRVFIGVVLFVLLHLLWMRFLEAALPLELCTVLSVIVGYVVVRYG